MPWKESPMQQRAELIVLAGVEGANLSAVCERLGISRKTAYKWLARARAGEGLEDRSRRPHASPGRTPGPVEEAVLRAREEHPAWGGRKLRRLLLRDGGGVGGVGGVGAPSASTVTAILHRHGLIAAEASLARRPMTRFEHGAPNDLWQMDFKGHVPMERGGRCHPLTVLDDHSRYCVGLRACTDERGETVQGVLRELFREHGLPERMLMDNGSPWGSSDPGARYTPLTVRLLRLGVRVTHGRPRHPQTQGKDERFHRTLKAEVLRGGTLRDRAQSQRLFDAWREVYNTQRPHEALRLDVPASRWSPSGRAYPERLGPIEYRAGDHVRRVGMHGRLHFRGVIWRTPRAFEGEAVAIRDGDEDGMMDVYYCDELIATLNLKTGASNLRPRPGSAGPGAEVQEP